MLIISISLVSGEMCEDFVELNANCTMLTPSLACADYDYEIYNLSGAMVENASLTLLNSSIYSFNFSQPEGSYIVKLCDGTTREIQVKPSEANKMIIAVIILLPVFISIILFIFAALTDPIQHWLLRHMLMLLGAWSLLGAFYLSMLGLGEFFNFPEFFNAVVFILKMFTYTMILISVYYFFYILYVVYQNFTNKKTEEAGL